VKLKRFEIIEIFLDVKFIKFNIIKTYSIGIYGPNVFLNKCFLTFESKDINKLKGLK
jgi:hypothetical protein